MRKKGSPIFPGKSKWITDNFPIFLRNHAQELGIELRDDVDPKTRKPVRVPYDYKGS